MRRGLTKDLSKTNPRTFRHLLTIQRNLGPKDASGGVGEDWQTVCVVKGSHTPLAQQGWELTKPDWTISVNQYESITYRRADISEQMRIVVYGRAYLITQAPQVARSERFMMIFSEEVKG